MIKSRIVKGLWPEISRRMQWKWFVSSQIGDSSNIFIYLAIIKLKRCSWKKGSRDSVGSLEFAKKKSTFSLDNCLKNHLAEIYFQNQFVQLFYPEIKPRKNVPKFISPSNNSLTFGKFSRKHQISYNLNGKREVYFAFCDSQHLKWNERQVKLMQFADN